MELRGIEPLTFSLRTKRSRLNQDQKPRNLADYLAPMLPMRAPSCIVMATPMATPTGSGHMSTEQQPNIKDFLLARIAEDEAVAQAVIPPGHAYTDGPLRWSAVGQAIGDATGYLVAYDIPGVAPRNHIARHDPARVLAECAAKRAILAEWGELPAIGWGIESEDVIAQQAAENTARALAATYSDHPDYQQEWALSGTR